MRMAGPLPRWLWDPTTHAWLLLRADGTLTDEAEPGAPPLPTDPMVRLKLAGWRETLADGTSKPIDPAEFAGGSAVLQRAPDADPGAIEQILAAPECPGCGISTWYGLHFPTCPELRST